MMYSVEFRNTFWLPSSWSPAIPATGVVSGTCTAAPLLFTGIPSCGFLPFYFSVCKFTFLTSVNLQFVPHPPEPFTSCRERSNAWFSNLWHPQIKPPLTIPFHSYRSLIHPLPCLQTEMHMGQIWEYKVWPVEGLEQRIPDFCRDGVFQGQVGSSGVLLCLTRCIQVQNLWAECPGLSLLSPSELWG